MPFKNIKLIDGRFQVLDLLSISLPGPWWWQSEDLLGIASGAVFRCYEEGNEDELAYILAADISQFPDEPDVARLVEREIDRIDRKLELSTTATLVRDGRSMTRWMSSKLDDVSGLKGLVTAYIATDNSKDRQYIDLRLSLHGRKTIVQGCFNVDRSEDLARPIYFALKDTQILARNRNSLRSSISALMKLLMGRKE